MGKMSKVVSAAFTSVLGAYLTNEFITSMGYTGPGSELVSLFALIVIAVGMLRVMDFL